MEPHNLEFGLVVFIRGCQFNLYYVWEGEGGMDIF